MPLNNGTLQPTSNPATFSADNGGVLVFDGTNDFISTSESFTATQVAAFSIGIWFKTTDKTGKKLIGFESSQTSLGGSWDRHLYIDTDGKLNFGVYNGTTFIITSPDSYADNYWYYAVGTYGNQQMKLYVNGVLIGSLSVAQAQPYAGWWRVAGSTLGGWNKGNNGTFAGRIGPVHAYTKELTVTEVLANYNSAKSRFYLDTNPTVTAVAGTGGLTLTISNVTNASSILIQRATSASGPWTDLATTTNTTYTDATAQSNVTYYYRAKYTQTNGKNSDWGSQATITPSFTAPELGTPTASSFDVVVVPLVKEAKSTTSISSYILQRSTDNGTTWNDIASGSATAIFGSPATSYRDAGRTGSTSYSYRLKARDASNFEVTSATVSVTTPANPDTGPFTNLRINCGGPTYTDSLGNVWIADKYFSGGTIIDDGSSGLAIAGTEDPTIYRTNRWDPPEGSEMTYTIPIVNGTYRVRFHFSENWSGAYANDVRVFNVLINGTQYLFDFDIFSEAGSTKALIKSVNATVTAGSELSNVMLIEFRRLKQNPLISGIEITSGAGPANPTPSAPTSFSATAISSSQINLAWVNTSNIHNRYIIDRAIGTTGTFAEFQKLPAGATSYSDTGLSGNTTYRYRLRARSSTGVYSTALESSATTQQSTTNLPPNAPAGLTATVASSSQINLSWSSVTNVTNYVVERAPGTSGGTFAVVTTLGNTVTSFNDTGLAANTTYRYQVRAVNAAGSSVPSGTATATTLASTITPRTPRLVQFSASNVILDKPWGGAFLPDGKLLVTERDSKKLIIFRTDGSKEKEIDMETQVMNVSSLPSERRDTISAGGGQNGLMDIVLDPQFATNRYVFWTYSRPNGGGKETAVGRGVFDVNALTITNFTRIYTQNRPFGDNNHFGARIAFHPTDNSLFVSFSDRKTRNAYSDGESRLLTSPIGKIIRIDRNGNAINDGQNPFPNNLGGIIWSRGHRGAQGLAFRLNESGFVNPPQLWETEQGEDGGDEVNLIVRGGDYGWGGIDENGVRNGGVGYGREYNWRFSPPPNPNPPPGQAYVYTMCIDEGWCAARDRGYRIPNVLIGGGNHTAIGAIEPKFIWPPTLTGGNFLAAVTGGGQSSAPTGLMFYSGKVFGQWAGHMFVPTLVDWKEKYNPATDSNQKYGTVYRLTLTGNNVTAHNDMFSDTTLFSALLNDKSHPVKRIRHVIEGPEGFIYIFVESSGGSSGKIWVLRT